MNVAINKRFWPNKRVLITGNTGFKGSWLSLWLSSMGAEIAGYALAPPTTPSLFETAGIASCVRSEIGDIRDFDHLFTTIKTLRPEIIFHMAAQSLVRYSYEHPLETFDANVMGTVNLLEAVRRTECVRAVVVITSDKCYENKEWAWGYRENDPMGGFDPYSCSKGCAELVTASYRRSFFDHPFESGQDSTAIASTRAGNVVGGGDWAKDRLIPDMMKAFMERRAPIIRYPKAIRPWQFVLEPLHGYLMLAEKLWEAGPDFAQAWNFGPEDADARPVGWIADRLSALWGGGARWEIDAGRNPHEAHYLKLDCSMARNILKWRPATDLSGTLDWIVQWYQAFQGNKDMREITLSQIKAFEKRIDREAA
jgi:CDP-glucose 4,6-dehydratase